MIVRCVCVVFAVACLLGCDSSQQQVLLTRGMGPAMAMPPLDDVRPPRLIDCVRADFRVDGMVDGTQRIVMGVPTILLPDGRCQAATQIACDGRTVEVVAELRDEAGIWITDLFVDGKPVYTTEAYDSGASYHTATCGPGRLGLACGGSSTCIQITWHH